MHSIDVCTKAQLDLRVFPDHGRATVLGRSMDVWSTAVSATLCGALYQDAITPIHAGLGLEDGRVDGTSYYAMTSRNHDHAILGLELPCHFRA